MPSAIDCVVKMQELAPMAQLHPVAQVALIVCGAAIAITFIIMAFKHL